MVPSGIPLLSIVIISTHLDRLLGNINKVVAAARGLSSEIIVVCQGFRISDEITCDNGLRLKIICFENRLGSSEARNQGINLARGEYVSFLDDDVYPEDCFFLKSIAVLEANNSYVATVGRIKTSGENGEDIFRKKFGDNVRARITGYSLWRLANGNSIVYRRTGLRYDQRLGIGSRYGAFEDCDYLLRASLCGGVCYRPECVVYHPEMTVGDRMDSRRMGLYGMGLGACLAKNFTMGGLIFFVGSAGNNLWHVFGYGCPLYERKAHVTALLAKLKGAISWRRAAARRACGA